MSAESKKSMALSAVFIALGVVALYSSASALAILVPVAIFVYYGTAPSTSQDHRTSVRRSGRGIHS